MKNFVQPGNSVPLTMTGTVSSGDVVEIGGLIGVVQEDGESGDVRDVVLSGVVDLPRNSADTFTEGLAVNFASGEVTTGAGTAIGNAVEDKSPGAGTVKVRLIGS